MTCVAYRDGVMAADSGSWAGDASHGWALKLGRGPNGSLYGCCGRADEVATFLAWLRRNCAGDQPRPRETPDGQSSYIVLLAEKGSDLRLITAYGVEVFTGAPYMAIGPEAQAALGAMYAGADAMNAVAAACEHGDRARLPVRYVEHETFPVFTWTPAPR